MHQLEKKEKFPSTFTVDKFSSTLKLSDNEIKLPIGSKVSLNEKEYNPFDHRQVEHPNSTSGSLIHLLKSSLGTGILAIPSAFKNAGLLFGLVGTVVVGIICTHCVHILVKASHEVCKKSKTPCLGYSETAGAVFEHGPKKLRKFSQSAKLFVDLSLIITYYMGQCVYIVFISGSTKKLVDELLPDLKWDITVYMFLVSVPLIIMCQIRELKYLVPFSFFANILMVISFGITLYYMFSDIQDVEERKMFTSFGQLPLFFSTVIFAMEGIGVVMPVENNMKHPQNFLGCPGVLNVAMGIVITLYTTIGFFGYLKYGDKTEGSITFNLPVKEIPAKIVNLCIALAVLFTYSLQMYVPNDITWRKVISPNVPESYHNIVQIVFRSVAVLFTVGVAALVPDLEPIIGLVGSICFSTLGLFIPAVIETVLCWEGELGVLKWKLFKNALLAAFAMLALVSGTAQSIAAFSREKIDPHV